MPARAGPACLQHAIPARVLDPASTVASRSLALISLRSNLQAISRSMLYRLDSRDAPTLFARPREGQCAAGGPSRSQAATNGSGTPYDSVQSIVDPSHNDEDVVRRVSRITSLQDVSEPEPNFERQIDREQPCSAMIPFEAYFDFRYFSARLVTGLYNNTFKSFRAKIPSKQTKGNVRAFILGDELFFHVCNSL